MLRFLLSFCLIVLVKSDQNNPLIVQTKNGLVKGREGRTVGLNLTYYAYQGIPYAEPPVENLRFEPPLPKKNWSGTLDATKDGSRCVQGNPPEGSEDCLFINVYVPKTRKHNKLLSTMVFIYGGGFEGGFADYSLYGPDYLLEKDVVVVTFNYRLGFFGFLSTGDMVVPGNNGLKDQVLALKWVKYNIENFGGNPNQVTLFGQSAGSASVSYQMQSRLSRGLFHKAIMESGVSLSPWAFSRRAPQLVQKISSNLNIDTSSNIRMVNELRKIDHKTLQITSTKAVASQYLTHDPRSGFGFGPVIEPNHDGAFLTNKSHEILSNGDFAKVPCIIGFNSLEGTFHFGTLFKLYLLQYDLNHKRLLPVDANISPDKQAIAAEHIKKYYFGRNMIAFSDRKLMIFLSDDLFVRPIQEYARLISKQVPVYYYRFSYEGGLWGFANRTEPGVTHSEELGYLWRSNFTASHADILTRKRMTTMWTDFAKTGNPTPKKYFTTIKTVWKKFDENYTYLDIGHELVLSQFPEKSSMELWDQIYQAYGNPPYDTY